MKLATVNSILLSLIIVVNGYVIAAPLLPAALYAWHSHEGERQILLQTLKTGQTRTSATSSSQVNSVIIPSMLLDKPILEGPVSETYQILDQGIWRWPDGSTPALGGNTILIGHRFTYTNPQGVFYYLNRVSIGDEIGVFWNTKEYIYLVSKVEQVPPSDTEIEANTKNPQLTLFTCTPLWLPKDRLVIIANLEQEQ